MASILVVDDEPANLDLLEALFTPAGYQVRTASEPIPALSAVKEALPDLVLLDLMMPGMNGFEVCERLQAEPRTANIPLITTGGGCWRAWRAPRRANRPGRRGTRSSC